MTTLKVVVSDHWFDEIKSGRKTHEYRAFSEFWIKRLTCDWRRDEYVFLRFACRPTFKIKHYDLIEFQHAYRKNPERMTFLVKNITVKMSGVNTDLKCDGPVFDIELGERIEE